MSNYILHDGELYHHGVRGMRWGVRRYQNEDGTLTEAGQKRYARAHRKELQKERGVYVNAARDRITKEYDIPGKREAAFDYGKKHNLDLDDGGGGDPKHGDKYMKMWDEIERLQDKADSKARSEARKNMVKKYGERTVAEFEKRQAKVDRGKMACAVVVAGSIAVAPYIALYAGGKMVARKLISKI